MPTQWGAGPAYYETTFTAGSGRSSYLPGLKEDYIEAFEAFLNSPLNKAANRFARTRDRMGGRRTVTEVPTQRPTGVGNRGEYERLPWAFGSTSINLFILAKKMAMRHRMTWELMASAAKGKNMVFGRTPWERDMEQLREYYALMRNEMIINGRFNPLGMVASYSNGASGAGTITLRGRNARRSTAALWYARGAFPHPFYVNQLLQFVDNANGIAGAPVNAQRAARVTAVTNTDQEAPTLSVQDVDMTTGADGTTSLATTFSIDAADVIIPAGDRRLDGTYNGTYTDDSNYYAMNGVHDFVSGTVHSSHIMGGSKSTVDGLRPNHMVHATPGDTRVFAERQVGLMIRLGQQRSGKTINRLYNAPSIMDEWFKENANLRRFETVMGNSGFDDLKITMHGEMVGPDVDWQFSEGCVVGYNTGFGGYFQQKPLGPPMPGDERWVQDYDLREAILLESGNTMRTRPFAESLYDDIATNAYDLT